MRHSEKALVCRQNHSSVVVQSRFYGLLYIVAHCSILTITSSILKKKRQIGYANVIQRDS